MLHFSEEDVRRLLPMREAIRVVRLAFEAWGRGEAQNQSRRRLLLSGGSALHSLAGAYGSYFGTKIYSTNPRHGAFFHFVLYDAETARPLALFDANHLGQIRTGAASGYATDLLAAPDASILGVIGSGFQAKTQIEAIRAVRSIEEVRVFSRTPEKRRNCTTAEEAVRGAHIVVTATTARDPVFKDEWLAPGAHINGMGSNIANRREIPAETVRRARVVAVDSLEQAQIEAGDLILADSWSNVVELKDLSKSEDRDANSITVFKSIGIGLEDVAAAAYVYEAAATPEPKAAVPNPAKR